MVKRAKHDSGRESLFLSEFKGFDWLYIQLTSRWGILRLCGCLMIWAIVALVLGAYAKANCITVHLHYKDAVMPLLFGYLAELNHGLFTLIGLPAFVFLVSNTVGAADAGFKQLRSGHRLTCGGSSDKAWLWIQKTNRRIFGVWIWLSLIISIAIIYYGERKSYNAGTFGWVQSGFARDWRGATLAGLGITNIPEAAVTIFDLKKLDAIATNSVFSDIKISNDVEGGSQKPEELEVLPYFLAVAFGLQCSFLTIGFWIIGKLVFIFYLLFQGFRNADRGDDGGLKLELDFQDKGRRFGLKAFDSLYDNALAMIAVGSIAFTLQHLGNSPKGTTFGIFERAAFFGHLVSAIMIIFVLAVVLLFPTFLFMRHTTALQELECNRLERERAALRANQKKLKPKQDATILTGIESQITALDNALDSARDQTPWPKDDWWFRGLTSLILLFLVFIPLGWLENAGSWVKPVVGFCSNDLPQILNRLESFAESILPRF